MKTRWFLLALVLCGMTVTAHAQSPTEHRDRGAVLGALLGGLTGAAIGDHNDEALAGAAIGAGVGAFTGGAVGNSVDNDIAQQQAYQQQRYQAAMGRAISVEDAISMSQAGLSDGVIITQIRTGGIAYRPRTEDLVRLSQMGVSDAVISAMQTAPLASATPVAPVPVHRSPVVVQERVYVAPVYTRPVPVYRPAPYYHVPHHGHHHPRGGVHWGFSIRR